MASFYSVYVPVTGLASGEAPVWNGSTWDTTTMPVPTATSGQLQATDGAGGLSAPAAVILSASTLATAVPLIGYTTGSSPYGVHGLGSQAMADANQTPAASVYCYGTIKPTSTTIAATRDLTLPAATDAAAYYKLIDLGSCVNAAAETTSNQGVRVKDSGAGTTVTLLNGTKGVVLMDSRGATVVAEHRGNVVQTNTADITYSGIAGTNTAFAFAIGKYEVWSFEFDATIQVNDANGMKFAVNGPTSMTVEGWAEGYSSSRAATNWQTDNVTALNTLGGAFCTVSGSSHPYRMRCVVRAAGTSGTVAIKLASVDGAATAKIVAGSVLRAQRLNTIA